MKAEDDAEAAAGPRVQDAAETEAVSPAAAGENTPGSPSSRREQGTGLEVTDALLCDKRTLIQKIGGADGEAAEAGAGVWPREVPRHRSSISSTGSGEIEEQPVLAERPPMYSLGLTACSPVEDAQESMASSPQYQEILQFFSGNPSVQQFKGEVQCQPLFYLCQLVVIISHARCGYAAMAPTGIYLRRETHSCASWRCQSS